MQTKTHLTFPERERIEFHRRLGRGVREIGRRLRRDHGVISRELRRDGKEGARYTARTAAAAEARRRGRRSGRKLERDPRLHEHVIRELRGGRSPDVMSGRMKLLPVPGLRGKTVSRESICRYVYGGEGRHGGLFRLLPCRRARRQKRGTGRSRQRSRIQERISIHARPEEVMGRMAFGHWESDTVICPRRGAVLSVQVERASRLPRFHRAPAKTAEDTERAIRRSVESLPSGAFRTMAFDDGTGGGEAYGHTGRVRHIHPLPRRLRLVAEGGGRERQPHHQALPSKDERSLRPVRQRDPRDPGEDRRHASEAARIPYAQRGGPTIPTRGGALLA